MPVVVLAFMAPGNLQGLGPTLSHALSGALAEVTPPIREIPTDQTLNLGQCRDASRSPRDLRSVARGAIGLGAGPDGPAASVHRFLHYWVQQVRANGETVAVKVLHAAAGQIDLGMSEAQRNAVDAPASEG